MAEESEKRFHAIMDKLFLSPPTPTSKSPPSNSLMSPGVQLPNGKKRPHVLTALPTLELKSRGSMIEDPNNSPGAIVQAPLCRPWDRGDLFRRLATFKSMTWFAKPEVVSAVNCARRGWVNVDMDIIVCESCGARLLFSTPSSWSQHQVEKAALVFSLKLNSGHKLLCPWVDNACTEALAQFPPKPAAVLVDDYKKRYAALLKLVALPVISSAAIACMRNPELEHFLNRSSTVESANEPSNPSVTEFLENEFEAIFSDLYYQAQKIISLCGWECRLLPYVVDCKGQDQPANGSGMHDTSHKVSDGKTPSINVYLQGIDEKRGESEEPGTSGLQFDPSSIVLDCKLCGASVGLWTFCTTPRPLEFVRLVGFSDVYDENNAASFYENQVTSTEKILSAAPATTGGTSSNGGVLNLNLTIAGGIPPTKQNFRPKISVPVVGQTLRARFSADSKVMDDHFSKDKEHNRDVLSLPGSQQEAMSLILDEENGDKLSLRLDCSNLEAGKSRENESSSYVPLEEANIRENEAPETILRSRPAEKPVGDMGCMILSNGIQIFPDIVTVNEPVGSTSSCPCNTDIGNTSISTVDGPTPIGDDIASFIVASALGVNPETLITCDKQVDTMDDRGLKNNVKAVNNDFALSYLEKDPKRLATAMEFDPIRQHRHFCPWTASSEESIPGWKQTLHALQRQKEFSSPLSTSSPSSFFIKVDDPIGSVRKLFSSPSSFKRKKLAHGSS